MKPLLFAAIALALSSCAASKPEEEAKPIVTVKVAAAEERDIEVAVKAPATIFPREQANIASRITAPIQDLPVRKGDNVTKGQLLARLDGRDITAQRKELSAFVTDTEVTLERIRSGTLPGDIERAKGQVQTTEAALSQAQKFFERRKQLFEQGAIPNRDLQISQTELATAQANYDVAKLSLGLIEKQSSGRDIQIAQSKVDQARGKLAVNDTMLAFTELRSPFAGTITEQFVFPGDMAQPATPIFTIADLQVAIARAQVPESEASAIKRGGVCRMVPQDQPAASFTGRVTVVNQAVDPQRRTVEVWCEISNGKGELRAQAFGTVEFVTGTLPKAVTVPVAAVQFEEGGRKGFVMIFDKDKKAAKREIEAGATVDGRVPILKGLAKGDRVIVEGAYGLTEGTALTLAETEKK